jgi:acyl carrier protein
MTDREKFDKIFVETFKVKVSDLSDEFSTDTVANWDSVTQLSLVTAMEDEFDVMLDSEDILDFNSYKKAVVIMGKYDISL